MSVYERMREEKRDARYAEWAKVPKASTADWVAHKTRGQRIGDWYRKRAGEELYKRLYEEALDA